MGSIPTGPTSGAESDWRMVVSEIVFSDKLYCRKCKRRRSYTRTYQNEKRFHLTMEVETIVRKAFCSYCGSKLAEDIYPKERDDDG